ncbi:rsmA, RAS family GTPase [Dictyostelium purpureum]|uniref:RsmA, RAS family GTPase n=1 Tax=Dictyostelium purpureum TaxID=5786 RepID=F1A0N3_DICPU|nr:rsmA, RAS family GTPase [Dictyostelium purpureum]EGC30255.1 rsmA, RAS family GTPase [Dictyostelium purpureum]|eukprot:XP_003293227.1 rsmA, RAS family GTPase [Dictyostelium purpureum]
MGNASSSSSKSKKNNGNNNNCKNACNNKKKTTNECNNKKEVGPKNYKLIVLGSSGVGKTSYSFRFVSNIFITEYDPTVEDAYKKDYTYDGKEMKLEIIDTAGQEEYSSGVMDKSIRCGDGFVLVYSITSRESYQKIKDLREKILWVKDKEKVPMIIVGNKSDIEKDRKVTKSEARALAEEYGCKYIETSAKTNTNISESMDFLLKDILFNESKEKENK